MSSPRRLFCFGLGYTALGLARARRAEGWAVAGTCRTEANRLELVGTGIEARLFDGVRPLAPEALDGVTHVLSSVPPGPEGDPVLLCHEGDIAALAGLAWLGYLSTTGVYGDRGGGWVDEGSALEPTGERGRRRVEAERRWLALWRDRGLPVHVFRLAGIYGPGRSALDAVRAGRARRVHKPGQVFSRIHVDDIVAAASASMARPNPGAVYNLCDDDPAPPEDVVTFACALLGVEPPPLVPFREAGLSEMASSFYADNKRVRNDRMKRELGVRLEYPDYRTGLSALLAAGA
ncbi:MAG: SDR family oxidoreductase [Alphaproteobacteria bacterium]